MITEYGMSPQLGTLNYSTEQGYQKNYSDLTNQKIDREVSRIINAQYLACREILTANKEKIELLAEKLLETETLSLNDIVEIMGERPFPMKETVREYLEELQERKMVDDELDAEEAKLKEESAKEAADKLDLKFDMDAYDEAEKQKEKDDASETADSPAEKKKPEDDNNDKSDKNKKE